MKTSLAPGLSITKRVTIDRQRTIDFMGEELRVYATPWMLRDIEHTCRDLILEHLDEGEDSVGVQVELEHLGATLLDMWVDISARIIDVDGRRVTLEVEVKDELDLVGKAKHARFVLDKAKQKQRLTAKAAKVRNL